MINGGFIGKMVMKMTIEIVDFPSYKMVDLSMAKCDSSPEGTRTNIAMVNPYIYIYIWRFYWENHLSMGHFQ